jgi:hypothetical protein
MPLRLADLANEVTSIELAFGDEILKLEAYIKRLTPALISDLSAIEQGGAASIEHAVAVLLKLV